MKYLDSNGLLYLIQKIKTWLNGKVDKVDGKGLSTNDYTTTEKNKLAGISTGANKTTVENNLTSTSTTNALSAAQGMILDTKITTINNAGYQTATQVEDIIRGKNYQTLSQVVAVVDGRGYQTAEQVETAITSKNYQTLSQVSSIVDGRGYQTASQVNTLIGNAIADIQGISYEIVTSLPSKGEAGVIYLISNNGNNPNSYDEYIYANSKFEKIGTTDVDLSGYLTGGEITADTNIYDLESGIYYVNEGVKLTHSGASMDGEATYTTIMMKSVLNVFKIAEDGFGLIHYTISSVFGAGESNMGTYYGKIEGMGTPMSWIGAPPTLLSLEDIKVLTSRVTSITSSSTNNEMPTAKSVYKYVTDNVQTITNTEIDTICS